MKRIYLETFGCQMNVLDSELVECQLRALGYAFTPSLEEAEVVIYNTCSVRERAEQKVWSRLGLLRERKAADPSLVIGVIGCMAERDGVGLMKRMPQVDLMCGPSELDQLPTLLENVFTTGRQQHALAGNTSRRTKTLEQAGEAGGEAEQDGLELLDLGRSFSPERRGSGAQRYQAYIRIVRGCNKFCTYCVVPYTRGAEVSRSPGAIVEEARKLVEAGCLEITLLGQTVNHYVYEHEMQASTASGPMKRRTTFAELLAMLHEALPTLPRLRFLTSFPADFGDDILHVMNDCPRICRYLHIPAQSGSNRILRLMNRGYTAESYLQLVERARKIVPGIHLAGDFIVGFPTETNEDYVMTRELVEKARYKNCFIFKYSPRPGTTAIRRHADDVSEEVKRFRNNDLLRVQNRISNELNRQLIGQTVSVLCDGATGWSDDEESVVAGRHRGDCVPKGEKVDGRVEVELGASLRAGLQRGAGSDSQVRIDRQGQPYRAAVMERGAPEAGWVQLSGRTSHDQVVIFYGGTELKGQMVEIGVREAHGMTMFGDVAGNRAAGSGSEVVLGRI